MNPRVDPTPVQEELAAAKDAGSTDRFVRLVIPHLNDAYTLARWITGNRIDAEDVVQDACLRAFRAISNAGHFNARAWMLGAVRSAAFAWLRKYRPASLVPPDEFGPVEHERMRAWDCDGATPEAALIAKTDAARLEAAIVRLPAPFREVLALRNIQGLSYREIADITAVPVGTVMSRLARGRTRLIRLITRESHRDATVLPAAAPRAASGSPLASRSRKGEANSEFQSRAARLAVDTLEKEKAACR